MLIGLDFDNTIADYSLVFQKVAYKHGLVSKSWSGDKKELKKTILNKSGGEESWMRVQGKVYGEFMHQAIVMSGIMNFLIHCKVKSIPVCIVSHKTQYGHYESKKISLREEAKRWMKKKGFFDENFMPLSKDDVYFSETREGKVRKISELGCTHFIDDLKEVFQEPKFPRGVKKILFTSGKEGSARYLTCDNWYDIKYTLLGNDDQEVDKLLAKSLLGDFPDSFKQIKGRGNSRVYKVTKKKKKFALKIYPNKHLDERPRLKTEFSSLAFLHKNSILNVPKPVSKDINLNIGLYSWIEGKTVEDTSKNHLDDCIDFVKLLNSLETQEEEFDLASQACLSGVELRRQIRKRLEKLISEGKDKNLNLFLVKSFSPLLKQIEQKYFKKWPLSSKDTDLIKEKRILSPSDFGFHNALLRKNKGLCFLDFDYFGWDDPVKLVSDFYWHPAMDLTNKQRNYWIEATEKIFMEKDKDFNQRLMASMPFYGLRWILIILNEFLDNSLKIRRHVRLSTEYNSNSAKRVQLKKATKLCFSLEKFIKQDS